MSLFSTTILIFYNHTVNWAFTSKEKNIEFTQNEGHNVPIKSNIAIVYTGENEITIDIPVKLSNLFSFFDGIKLKNNNGNGTRDIVTFIGADFIDDMQNQMLDQALKQHNHSRGSRNAEFHRKSRYSIHPTDF